MHRTTQWKIMKNILCEWRQSLSKRKNVTAIESTLDLKPLSDLCQQWIWIFIWQGCKNLCIPYLKNHRNVKIKFKRIFFLLLSHSSSKKNWERKTMLAYLKWHFMIAFFYYMKTTYFLVHFYHRLNFNKSFIFFY